MPRLPYPQKEDRPPRYIFLSLEEIVGSIRMFGIHGPDSGLGGLTRDAHSQTIHMLDLRHGIHCQKQNSYIWVYQCSPLHHLAAVAAAPYGLTFTHAK